MEMTKTDKDECLFALSRAHSDEESYRMVEKVICDYFSLMRHLNETSLFDILVYEERITKATVEPMNILVYENERLKKEVNKLRRELGKIEKYRED